MTSILKPNLYEDTITTLPTTDDTVSQQDMNIFNMYLNHNDNDDIIKKIFNNYKEIFIGTILFVILSLPYTTEMIHKLCIPTQKSNIILLSVKTAIFIGLFFLTLSFILK